MIEPEALRQIGRWTRSAEPGAVAFLVGFVAAALLSRLSAFLARRAGAVAKPDARSLHETPTPRLGGLGLGCAIIFGTIFLEVWPKFEPYLTSLHAPSRFVSLIALGGGAALLCGLLDDLFDLPPIGKLWLQVAVAVVPLLLFWRGVALYRFGVHRFGVPWLDVPGFQPARLDAYFALWLSQFELARAVLRTPGGVQVVATAACGLWIVLMMNVSNFLDGADGQAALFAGVQALFFAAIFASSPRAATHIMEKGSAAYDSLFFIAFFLLVFGASLGFLTVNFPPAEVFLGDCGSHFLGFLWASTGLYCLGAAATIQSVPAGRIVIHNAGAVEALGLAVALGPQLFDFFYTLAWRIFAGRSITRPHREHLYQRLVLSGLSHRALLALHLPYYLGSALAGFVLFHSSFGAPEKWAAGLLAAGSWIAYALFAKSRERVA